MYGNFMAQFWEEALGGGDVTGSFGVDGSAAEIEEQYDAAVSTEEKTINSNWGGAEEKTMNGNWGGAKQVRKVAPDDSIRTSLPRRTTRTGHVRDEDEARRTSSAEEPRQGGG